MLSLYSTVRKLPTHCNSILNNSTSCLAVLISNLAAESLCLRGPYLAKSLLLLSFEHPRAVAKLLPYAVRRSLLQRLLWFFLLFLPPTTLLPLTSRSLECQFFFSPLQVAAHFWMSFAYRKRGIEFYDGRPRRRSTPRDSA